MRLNKTFSLLAFAAIAAPAAAQAQSRPAIVVRAEQCLRQNADKVVAAEHDLQAAAGFLVTYACAGEVSGAIRYERNNAYVQMFTTISKMMPTPVTSAVAGAPKPPTPPVQFKGSVDPETGDLVLPPPAPGAPADPFGALMPMMTNMFGQFAPETVPVNLRKMAGELVLAAHDRAAAKAR